MKLLFLPLLLLLLFVGGVLFYNHDDVPKPEPEYNGVEITTGSPGLMPTDIVFEMTDDPGELLRLEADGDILYKGKLIESDKELVDALRALIIEGRCPACRKQRGGENG